MPAERTDPVSLLQRIRELATGARGAAPDVLEATLDEIAALASRQTGDTAESSDTPRTENQSL